MIRKTIAIQNLILRTVFNNKNTINRFDRFLFLIPVFIPIFNIVTDNVIFNGFGYLSIYIAFFTLVYLYRGITSENSLIILVPLMKKTIVKNIYLFSTLIFIMTGVFIFSFISLFSLLDSYRSLEMLIKEYGYALDAG